MSKNESIKILMEKAFDKILPIPKVPKTYTPPLPPKAYTWVPTGTLGNWAYEERLKVFANEIKAIDSRRTKRIKASSRGWCYLIEGFGKINKDNFNQFSKAINDCRKIGLLPIDFVAEDQDTTRHIKGIHEACNPASALQALKIKIHVALSELPTLNTDYWKGEEYYLIMCVEKGDILNLFRPICRRYHVPIASSKGWPPILLRGHIAELCERAESNGLTPVLLLFYDHDPAGMKISDTFKKNLRDCERGIGWSPDNLIVDRFGLNEADIEKYNLMWIDNLKTSSGRESNDWNYINKYGQRKCESNALFKNDETLKAAEEICRSAIEEYYGIDAIERFNEKEDSVKEKLSGIYDNQLWKDFDTEIDEIVNELLSKKPKEEKPPSETIKPEEEIEVILDNKYFGRCPRCNHSFDYDPNDIGKLVRCRFCNLPIRLKSLE